MLARLVIFDLDGTLIDTIGDLAAAVDHALSVFGFPGHSIEEYRKMVGHGIRNLVTRSLPEGASEETVDAALAEFVKYYKAHIDDLSRPYPGMQALLRRLTEEGISIAVASNKFQEGTQMLMRRFFPDIPFICILGNREGFPLKPDPQIVNEVLRRSGQPADAAALVGDSPTDMKTAWNGGIRGIAVQWGYRDMAEGDGYSVAGSPAELRALLLG